MNVNETRTARPSWMQEAPGTRPTTPSEMLAILKRTHDEPAPIRIGSLWKTGLVPQGAAS